MKNMLIVFVLAVLTQLASSQNSQNHLELEKLQRGNDVHWVWRSEASQLKTYRIEAVDDFAVLNFGLCLKPLNKDKPIKVRIDNIRYSNDGPQDDVIVLLDGKQVGTFRTNALATKGDEWNLFQDTGSIGKDVTLNQGPHELTLKIKTDKWGLELDTIRVNLQNQDPNHYVFCRINGKE